MLRVLESFGRAATADATVLYSPDVLVPERTTNAPDGGEVRVAPKATCRREIQVKRCKKNILTLSVVSLTHRCSLYSRNGKSTEVSVAGRKR